MGISDLSRASIRMAHDHDALTVSLDEASRLESELARHLLQVKKLSLIVDLDQTIMHATVDPTVGDWMKDERNPNNEALKDVQKFRLADEGSRGLEYYIKMRYAFQSSTRF
jgi:RNA polymerase II subunit A-like phosphatase